jgi:soluble lytic murein transglycosylase-like protein
LKRLLAGTLLPLAVSATATERIYESRSATGLPVFSHAPVAGARLVMELPPMTVRATHMLRDARSAVWLPLPRRSSPAALPRDPAVASLVRQAAHRHALDMDLLLALIRQESGFNTLAVSRAGARGLMQLMPGTASRYGVRQVHDPGENIAAGSAYLRDLLDRFGRVELALAAYNAGEGAVEKYGRTIPPYPETQQYVAAVMADYAGRKRSAAGRP